MTPAQISHLESEFVLQFPAEYRQSLADELPYPIESDYTELQRLNRLWRDNPQWGFDWKDSFWCIGCPGIPDRRAIEYHFINCEDAAPLVYSINQDDPAWSITDERRICVLEFSEFVNELQDGRARADEQREMEIEKLKRCYKVGFWRRLTGPRPPKLPPAPDWMAIEVSRRTELDDLTLARSLLSRTTAETAWAIARADDREACERLSDRDVFYGGIADSALAIDPIEADDRFAAVLLRAHLEAERQLNGRGFGECYRFWTIKQATLREQYGVRWQTPAQLNPDVDFD